jgi:hypothetical protein
MEQVDRQRPGDVIRTRAMRLIGRDTNGMLPDAERAGYRLEV